MTSQRRSQGDEEIGRHQQPGLDGMERPLTCKLWGGNGGEESVSVVCACGCTGLVEPLKSCCRRTCLIYTNVLACESKSYAFVIPQRPRLSKRYCSQEIKPQHTILRRPVGTREIRCIRASFLFLLCPQLCSQPLAVALFCAAYGVP